MHRIKYTCAVCGWHTSVPEVWADIKPTYCGNSKCSHSKTRAPKTKKSFKLDPEALIVSTTSDKVFIEKKVTKTRKKKKKVHDVRPFEEQSGSGAQGSEDISS